MRTVNRTAQSRHSARCPCKEGYRAYGAMCVCVCVRVCASLCARGCYKEQQQDGGICVCVCMCLCARTCAEGAYVVSTAEQLDLFP